MNLFPVKAAPGNYEDYFELRCDRNNIIWSGHKAAPDTEKLKEWYLQNIKRADRIFYLFYKDNSLKKCIAYLYMDKNAEQVDIGYGVHSDFNGKGYGTAVISFARDFVQQELRSVKEMIAWVSVDNFGSVKVFLKNGFKRSDETKNVSFDTGAQKLFVKYYYLVNG